MTDLVKPDYEITRPSNWGGSGRNQGRKHSSDKKKQLYVMIRTSRIKALGGEDAVKKIMLDAVEKAKEP